MADEAIGFIYTFSADITERILKGEIPLSTGGTRRKDGTLLEMGKPLAVDTGIVRLDDIKKSRDTDFSSIAGTNEEINLMADTIEEIKNFSWLQYTTTCKLYEMSYSGFIQTLRGLDQISTKVDGISKRMNEKDDSDNCELLIRYLGYLKSDAGIMEVKNFNATDKYSPIVDHLNEIYAYLTRLFKDLKTGTGDNAVILRSISYLIWPFCYVIRRYSMLYYYENDCFPAGFDDWVEIVEQILRDMRFKDKLVYLLRVNTELPLPEIKKISKKILINLNSAVSNISFDKKYCMCHLKDEYLNLPKQIEEKIKVKDYRIIDRQMYIELK